VPRTSGRADCQSPTLAEPAGLRQVKAEQETSMDYSKSGGGNTAKTSPKSKRGAQKGAPKAPAQDKSALLARMKAAAVKSDKP
jgi:hypothetical protein